MKNIFLFSFLLFFSSYIHLSAQQLPDYNERTFSALSDSLLQLQSVSATEGSVDAETYLLGPGDKIFISISGLEEVVFTLVIDQEGNLYIPKVGGIDLNNSNFLRARDKLLLL